MPTTIQGALPPVIEPSDLPTDEQYRDFLFECWRTPRDDIVIAHSLATNPDWLAHVEPDLATDFLSSSNFSRGQLIRALQRSALALTGDVKSQLSLVPVTFLPNEDLNACAVRTPRGGAVILLNTSLVNFLPFITMCAAAVLSESAAAEMSPNLQAGDYAASLYCIAIELLDPGQGMLKRSPLFTDPVLQWKIAADPDFQLVKMNQGSIWTCELFILLHEYGHVALGHLDTSKVRQARGGSDVAIYIQSHEQEFQADAFALACLFNAASDKERAGLQLKLGILFGFLALLEACIEHGSVTSHPSARERWNRLRLYARTEEEILYARMTENAFDQIIAIRQRIVDKT